MRLRLTELLEERGWSAYDLARALDGRINERTAYRLAADDWTCLKREHLSALCDVLKCEPGDLLTRDRKRR